MEKEDVLRIYNGIARTHENNRIMSFAATRMDLEMIILSAVIQTEDKYHRISLTVESKKMIQMNLFTNQKQTHSHRKRT